MGAKISFGVVKKKHPLKKTRNSHVRTVVKADTPTAIVTKGKEQYSAPLVIESLGGTVTISAYNFGKKRCLSAEAGSGNPRKKVFEQNDNFTRAFRKSSRRLSEDEIRAEAYKQKEMRDAARAAEMTEEELALEKLKDLAGKEAARRAATGHSGKDKRNMPVHCNRAAQPRFAIARRATAPRKCAPRNSRHATRAAQPRLHAAPILKRSNCSTSSEQPL
jgi:hypothetical protein